VRHAAVFAGFVAAVLLSSATPPAAAGAPLDPAANRIYVSQHYGAGTDPVIQVFKVSAPKP
jgi:hypothetical protein